MTAARLVIVGESLEWAGVEAFGGRFGGGSFRLTVDGGNLEAVTACIARAFQLSDGEILDAWLEPPEGFECPRLGFDGCTFPPAADVVAKARACRPRDAVAVITVTT